MQPFKYKVRRAFINENGEQNVLIAEISLDDECKNGRNSFAITGKLYGPYRQCSELQVIHENGKALWMNPCGCLHEEICKRIPELAPFIKWHLTSTDGPMHYIANAKYWYGASGWCDGQKNSPPNLEYFKNTIVYGALDNDFELFEPWLKNYSPADWPHIEQLLINRLPELLAQFRADLESLEFTKAT